MSIRAMIHHLHGGTSLISIPEGPKSLTCQQALDLIWATLNDPDQQSSDDIIVNSGQPGDLITFIGRTPFGPRHAVIESEGFTTFMTTEFAIKHLADQTVLLHGIYPYRPPEPADDGEVHDPPCACCGYCPASVHEASMSFCATCYEAGAARDDRDQT